MESTSSSDSGRQSRGLARFWPVHGMPTPGQRQAAEDRADEKAAAPDDVDADAADETRTGDAPDALTSDTQMVALGSRRAPEVINGARPWNDQGGFPPPDADRGFRNADNAVRHGGAPVPSGQAAPRSPFGPAAAPPGSSASVEEPVSSPFASGPRSPFAPGPQSPFAPGPRSPFAPEGHAPASPFTPQVTARSTAGGSGAAPTSGAPRSAAPTSGAPASEGTGMSGSAAANFLASE